MKKYLLAAAAAGALLASSTGAFAEAVKLQLKWVTQAQFAGYYVAQAKGFYKDAGLEVTILPGGPDINPQQVLAGGGADVVIDWMPSALATREKGSKVVNIAQSFKKNGNDLARAGVERPAGEAIADGIQSQFHGHLVVRLKPRQMIIELGPTFYPDAAPAYFLFSRVKNDGALLFLDANTRTKKALKRFF